MSLPQAGSTRDLAELLSACDREPIHLTPYIQPHGVYFVLRDPDLRIEQLSRNTEAYFGIAPEALLDKSLMDLLPEDKVRQLREALDTHAIDQKPTWLMAFEAARPDGRKTVFDVIAHRMKGVLNLELEARSGQDALPELDAFYRDAFLPLHRARTVEGFCHEVARAVRGLTGYDRVMVYKFDEDGNGQVVAEDNAEGIEAWLGLHYPASDIPRQARELYRRNWTRIVPDVDAENVPLWPSQQRDLTYASLRSLSPVHIEYLKNMGVASSMSISIIKEGELWGLIACHHPTPRLVPYKMRMACEFMGQLLSLQLSRKEDAEQEVFRHHARRKTDDIVDAARNDGAFPKALLQPDLGLSEFIDAGGLAICYEGQCHLMGRTPDADAIRKLAAWLQAEGHDGLIAIGDLPRRYPEAETYKSVASGVVGFSLGGGNCFLWFRPEAVETVHWAGNPNKPVEESAGEIRLHPRKSFELWKETVQGKSKPWTALEIEAVGGLRAALTKVILERAMDALSTANIRLARSNEDLDAFAYVVSHDLNGLIRRIHMYTELLRQETPDLSPQGEDYANRIQTLSERMNKLVDDVLQVSRITSKPKPFELVDLNAVLEEVMEDLQDTLLENGAQVDHEKLPVIEASDSQMYQLFHNLIGNALKYRRPEAPPRIAIRSETVPSGRCHIAIRDNGLGFPEADARRIFELFVRLETPGKVEGSGIGLTICKRIVERHHGGIRAESQPGEGTTFHVELPLRQSDESRQQAATRPD